MCQGKHFATSRMVMMVVGGGDSYLLVLSQHLFTFVQTQEFLVLGSQRLTELRDNIYCLTDNLMEIAGEHDPSGYFLIEVSPLFISHSTY